LPKKGPKSLSGVNFSQLPGLIKPRKDSKYNARNLVESLCRVLFLLTEIWGVIAEEAARFSLLATSVQLYSEKLAADNRKHSLADR
jgi:hypothetical protein